MSTLTVASSDRTAGLLDTALMSAADAGLADEFPNSGLEVLVIDNAGASICNLTIATPNSVDGNAVADLDIAVAIGARKIIGPFPTAVYNASTSVVNLTYDQVSSVTVGVFKLGSLDLA